MKISTKCPNCSKTFSVEEDYVGRKGKCPACQSSFVIAKDLPTPKLPVEHSKATASSAVFEMLVDKPRVPSKPKKAAPNLIIAGVAGAVVLVALTGGAYMFVAGNTTKPTVAKKTEADGANIQAKEVASKTNVEVETAQEPEKATALAVESTKVPEEDSAKPETASKDKRGIMQSLFLRLLETNTADLEKKSKNARVEFGMLDKEEQDRVLAIEAKHDRIAKQIDERFRGNDVAVEQYTDDEMLLGIGIASVAASTIRRQYSRSAQEPDIEKQSVKSLVERIAAAEDVRQSVDESQNREICLPGPRTFEHSVQILMQRNPKLKRLAYGFGVDLDPAQITMYLGAITEPDSDKIDDSVTIGFSFFSEGWNDSGIEQITILYDGKRLPLKVDRGLGKDLLAEVGLEDLQQLVRAKRIEVKAGKSEFELSGESIEAMRDFASRLPDGKTTSGRFVVKHEPDGVFRPKSILKPGMTPREEQVQLAIAIAKRRLKSDVVSTIEQISASKDRLKQAKITDDTAAIAKEEKLLSGFRGELKQFMEAPFGVLDPKDLAAAQIGELPTNGVNPMRANGREFDKPDGAFLLSFTDGPPPQNFQVFFQIYGLKARTNPEGSRFPDLKPNLKFVVVGRTTHQLNKFFTLRPYLLFACDPPIVNAAEFGLEREIADANAEVELNDEEDAQAKMAQETNANENAKKTSIAKIRRCQTYLDLAKQLLKKDNNSAARKQLEKAIAEAPDSDPGKEAVKLLDKLP